MSEFKVEFLPYSEVKKIMDKQKVHKKSSKTKRKPMSNSMSKYTYKR